MWKQPEPAPDSSHTGPFHTRPLPPEASDPRAPGSKDSSSDHSYRQCSQEGGAGEGFANQPAAGSGAREVGARLPQVRCPVHLRASQALNWKRSLLGPSGTRSPAGMSRNPLQGAVFSVWSLTSTALSSVTWPLGQSTAALCTRAEPGLLEVHALRSADQLGCQ